MKVIYSTRFERSYKKFTKNKPALHQRIIDIVFLLSKDFKHPQIKTHQLDGKLKGYLSCSCGYDCRILFRITEIDGEKTLVLMDIGTHSEVY